MRLKFLAPIAAVTLVTLVTLAAPRPVVIVTTLATNGQHVTTTATPRAAAAFKPASTAAVKAVPLPSGMPSSAHVVMDPIRVALLTIPGGDGIPDTAVQRQTYELVPGGRHQLQRLENDGVTWSDVTGLATTAPEDRPSTWSVFIPIVDDEGVRRLWRVHRLLYVP